MCKPGKYSSGKSQCLICADSTYTNVNATVHCLPCTNGLVCNSTTGTASPARGFWSFVLPNDRFGQLRTVPCVQPELCQGADPSAPSLTKCDASRLQSPLNVECSRCASGFSEWQGTCVRCDKVHAGMVILLVLASWVYVLFTHKLSQSSAGSTSIFMFFIQTALLVTGSNGVVVATGVSWLNLFGMHAEDVGGGGTLLPCLGPISSTGKVWLSLGINLVFLAQLGLTALLHWFLSSRVTVCSASWPWVPSAYVRTLLALVLYSFTSLTATAISFIDCVDIGPFQVVALRPAIDCRSPQYQSLLPVAILVLVLCFLLPIALLVGLLRKRANVLDLSNENADDTPTSMFHSLAILFEAFKTDKFLFVWTVVVLLRRTTYVVCTTIHALADRFVAFTIISVFFCFLQSVAQPYRDSVSNHFELLSMSLLAAVSAVLIGHPQPTAGDATSSAVSLLILLPSVLFLLYLLIVTVRSKGSSTWARVKKQLTSPLLSSSRALELQ